MTAGPEYVPEPAVESMPTDSTSVAPTTHSTLPIADVPFRALTGLIANRVERCANQGAGRTRRVEITKDDYCRATAENPCRLLRQENS